MNESIAANYRLAIGITMLAELILVVSILLYMAMNMMWNFEEKFGTVAYAAPRAVANVISSEDAINAALAYKYITANQGKISSLSIKFSDGTTTDDASVLLERATCWVNVKINQLANGIYEIELNEVDR